MPSSTARSARRSRREARQARGRWPASTYWPRSTCWRRSSSRSARSPAAGAAADRAPDLGRLPRGALGYLALVGGKCPQDLLLLPLGHLEEVERPPELGCDF